MEALLLAVSANVIAPLQLARSFVNGVEVARTRTNEQQFPHDRGGREHSTPRFVLPAKFGLSCRGEPGIVVKAVGATQASDRKQKENRNDATVSFHSDLADLGLSYGLGLRGSSDGFT